MIQNHVAHTALSLEPPLPLHRFQALLPEGPQQVGRREPGTLGAPAACWLPTGTGNISTLWSRESLKSLDYRARGTLA